MLKVIIVDDEPRICKLILNLVNWNELGMEVVGIAHNGIDALELIRNQAPNLVITDVRMPGYDGLEMIEEAKKHNQDLEFILISGYEEFSYAQKAMSFGVKDYLCKPIKKDNLQLALMRAQASAKDRERQRRLEEDYTAMQRDEKKIRASFLRDLILISSSNAAIAGMEEINQSFYFRFQTGAFRMIQIQIDPMPGHSKVQGIGDQQAALLKSALKKHSYDVELVDLKGNFYILINYCPEQKGSIQALLHKSLLDFKMSLAPLGLMVTFGCGIEVTDIQDLHLSLETAQAATDDRILKGTGQIIEKSPDTSPSLANDDRILELYKKLTKAIELLHVEKVTKAIDSLKEELLRDLTDNTWLSGSALKALVRDIVDSYYLIMRNNNVSIINGQDERTTWEYTLDHAYSVEHLFGELTRGITSSLKRVLEDEASHNLEQIRRAKCYIDEHYMEDITLEDLGAYLGFNPSYFSTLFKKETGTSFVEYLVKVRMEKTKELLKETDLRIQDICVMVGYSDVRHFRKLFTQTTGLSPKEYRRLFA